MIAGESPSCWGKHEGFGLQRTSDVFAAIVCRRMRAGYGRVNFVAREGNEIEPLRLVVFMVATRMLGKIF